MNDQQLLRYSRQIMLPQIGIEGQQRLNAAVVLIVGMGGLGAAVATYLAAAGVGRLLLVDFDEVELSNLQRQIIHTTPRIGQSKVVSAAAQIQALNPEVKVEPIHGKLEDNALSSLIQRSDLVVDASDNFATRFQLNRISYQLYKPLVSGAAIRFEGQVTLFSQDHQPSNPCYRCLYSEEGELDQRCSTNGVFAPVVGIIGTIQASEALKWLIGSGESLSGKLLLVDALTMEFRTVRLRRDPCCPVCAKRSPSAQISQTTG
ncbi:MAG: molybdopterin-synthase adenylyltransferase MoeB [Gammaproteobacteria bacterium]|nr:molybdopterin-synthase adenylyltransferase MoeB [Gammaproteobacteria bacterium]